MEAADNAGSIANWDDAGLIEDGCSGLAAYCDSSWECWLLTGECARDYPSGCGDSRDGGLSNGSGSLRPCRQYEKKAKEGKTENVFHAKAPECPVTG